MSDIDAISGTVHPRKVPSLLQSKHTENVTLTFTHLASLELPLNLTCMSLD